MSHKSVSFRPFWIRSGAILAGAVAFSLLIPGLDALALTAQEINQASRPVTAKGKGTRTRPNASIVKAQVLLARQGISPGEIDGKDGDNYRKAVTQFRRRENLGDGDVVDAATWQALRGGTSADIVSAYDVTARDLRTTFVKRIPHDFARQARMKLLGYRNAREMLAERFHMSEGLLAALNPAARYRKRGETLQVVSAGRPLPSDPVQAIEADKTAGLVRVINATGGTIALYPATIGSEDTPSPTGAYEVVRIAKNPSYHYDPVKNFQQGRNKRRLVLPKGPNNPVGTTWIALSRPTFGIHGTPEPSRIGKTSSHGCIRLTNWDAEELAQIAKPGTTVRFVD